MIKYRPDIDGLRAMAITAVVLYHAFPKFFKGGFVGVDVFFVISGYLITSILFRSLNTNTFSLYDFYTRRIKRIFPALVIMLTLCLTLGWFALNDKEYIQLALHAKASTLFSTNFVLAKEESGYFDVSSESKPLLHLWSLAIEEQFYIFWPLLLYVAYKKRLSITSVCVFVMVLSFTASIKCIKEHPIQAFYFPLNRCWELVAGALLASLSLEQMEVVGKLKEKIKWTSSLVKHERNKTHNICTLRDIASMLGFIINLASIFLFKKTDSFPGWYALFPVTGTILILASGEDSWVNKKILSCKLCVAIGLISYPLYLWHWPLLSLAFILEGHQLKVEIIWLVLAASFILAYCTYLLVEKPIRLAKNKKFIVFTLSILLGAIGIFSNRIITHKGYSQRLANLEFSIPMWLHHDQRFLGLQIDCPPLSAPKTGITDYHCIANSKTPRLAIIGDSHSAAFAYGLALHSPLAIVAVSAGGRPPFLNYISYDTNQTSHDRIVKTHSIYRDAWTRIVDSYSSIEYVVLASMGPVYFSGKMVTLTQSLEPTGLAIGKAINGKINHINRQDAFVEAYTETINFLISKGKRVIFVIDHPELDFDIKSCLKRRVRLSKSKVHNCAMEKDKVDARHKIYRELVARIQRQVPSLLVYDATSAFCETTACYGKVGNNVYYSDGSHLNVEGAKVLAKNFRQWYSQHSGLK